jgi:6-pyruvoyl-tetrahydropterin synthase
MKIMMLKTAAGPDGNYQAGQKYPVSENVGRRFIEAKAAVLVEAEVKPAVIETAAISPAEEVAVRPVAKPRGRKKK